MNSQYRDRAGKTRGRVTPPATTRKRLSRDRSRRVGFADSGGQGKMPPEQLPSRVDPVPRHEQDTRPTRRYGSSCHGAREVSAAKRSAMSASRQRNRVTSGGRGTWLVGSRPAIRLMRGPGARDTRGALTLARWLRAWRQGPPLPSPLAALAGQCHKNYWRFRALPTASSRSRASRPTTWTAGSSRAKNSTPLST